MGKPIKGVVLSLLPFTQSVNKVAHMFVLQQYGLLGQSLITAQLKDWYMCGLIGRLLEDRFLTQVTLKRANEFFSSPPLPVDDEFKSVVQRDVPDYEILFSQCFNQLLAIEDFPDFVSLDKIGDSVIVTWN